MSRFGSKYHHNFCFSNFRSFTAISARSLFNVIFTKIISSSIGINFTNDNFVQFSFSNGTT